MQPRKSVTVICAFGILEKLIEQKNCPKDLLLDIGWSNGIIFERFANLLKTGTCPENLQVNFKYSHLNDNNLQMLAEALESGNCPEGLEIDLEHNDITDKGVRRFIEALKSINCPINLSIKLKNDTIDANLLAEITTASAEKAELIKKVALSCITLQQAYRKKNHSLSKIPQEVLKYKTYSLLFPFPGRKKETKNFLENIPKKTPSL